MKTIQGIYDLIDLASTEGNRSVKIKTSILKSIDIPNMINELKELGFKAYFVGDSETPHIYVTWI